MISVRSALLGLALLGSLAGSAMAQAVAPGQAAVSLAYQPLEPGAPSPGPTDPNGPSL